MSEIEFAALCTAFFTAYEPLIKIWAGAVAGSGILAGAVMGLTFALRPR